ncbi:MAG TPA: hypothetical protein VE994_05940 [Terriglobales bacterium]|nr:hypothetical protein [Terriglobales bacterium]
MDQQLKKLMKELGEAINESLSDSEQIADVVSKIKAGGYDIFLVLEATIGFNKREDEVPAAKPATIGAVSEGADPQFSINSQDLKFLKSLRITVDDTP